MSNVSKYDYLIDPKDVRMRAKREIVRQTEELHEKLFNYYGDHLDFEIRAIFKRKTKEDKE